MEGSKERLYNHRPMWFELGSFHKIYSCQLLILRISSFLVGAWDRGSASCDTNPDLNLAILFTQNLPKVLVKLMIVV